LVGVSVGLGVWVGVALGVAVLVEVRVGVGVAVGVFVGVLTESYNSALARDVPLSPPAAKTCPLGNSVAVCKVRGAMRLAVMLQVPVGGS